MLNVVIYMTSGRTLSEIQSSREDAVKVVRKVRDCIDACETFWFGRTLVNPQYVEAVFLSTEGTVDEGYENRVDIVNAVEGWE